MANRLKMAEHQAILGLARLNWSYRRIAAELGVDCRTVSRHVKSALVEPPGVGPPGSNAAISITGSPGRRSRCESWRTVIVEALECGLTARRIWQDLKAEHGFVDSYQSVQRFTPQSCTEVRNEFGEALRTYVPTIPDTLLGSPT